MSTEHRDFLAALSFAISLAERELDCCLTDSGRERVGKYLRALQLGFSQLHRSVG